MHYYVVGDEDTVLGFRFAGVPGEVVETADQARTVLERFRSPGDTVILIVTDTIADMVRDLVNALRFDFELPLLVEVPSARGPSPLRKDLLTLIREAVGIKV